MPKRKRPVLDVDNSVSCSTCNKLFEGQRALRIHIAQVCLPRGASLAASGFELPAVSSSYLLSEEPSTSYSPDQAINTSDLQTTREDAPDTDTNQDSPTRGGRETHEAAQFEPVSDLQLPRSSTLAFRRLPEHQKHTLSREALGLLPLLCEKSAALSDKFLKVIKDKDFNADNVPWNSVAELHAFLDKEQVWEYVCVHEETGQDTVTKFYAHVRRDSDSLLQDLINSPEANGMFLESQPLYSGGRRVYTDFSSGKWLEQTQSNFIGIQAAVRGGLHSDANVLGLIFYSDAAEARRHQHKFHPLLVYIANFTLDGLRSQRGYRRIAYLPILDPADFATLSTLRFTELQRTVRHATYALALRPFKELSYSGFHMRCGDGAHRHFVPVIAAYVADIKEANEVFNVAPYPAGCSDINTLVSIHNMNNPEHEARPRTEAGMLEVLREAEQLREHDPAEAQKMLKSFSLSIPRLPPLVGFAHVSNVYSLYYPDRLHQSNRGLAETIMGFIQKRSQSAQLAKINAYIRTLPPFPGWNLPSFGLDVSRKATATELANLFKLLPVALLAVPALFMVFGEVMQELLEFQTLRDLEQHTDATMLAVDTARKRAQQVCVKKLTLVDDNGETVSMSPTEFCTPKFWLMRLWPHTISMFGSANLTSTGYGERSHVAMKEAFQYTNQHSKEAIDVQSIQHAARRDTAARMVASTHTDVPNPRARSQSAAQRAISTGKSCLTQAKTVMAYCQPGDTSELSKWLGHDARLLLFQRALGIALGAARDCDFADLPQTRTGTVRVASGMGVAHQLHRGSSHEGVMLRAKESRHDCIRVCGDRGAVWYAELWLLFSYEDLAGQEVEAAFVTWFKTTRRSSHSTRCKLLPLRREVYKPRGRPLGPRTDVIGLNQIIGPCYIQPDPVDSALYYYNHWVGNTSNNL